MNEPDLKIRKFFDNLHTYRYPQPIVAATIIAKTNDLNTWRRDGLLFGDGWEKDTRVRYTGVGALFAGVMNELAPVRGPKAASKQAQDLVNYFMAIAEGREPDWAHHVMIFSELRQMPVNGFYLPEGDEDGWDHASRSACMITEDMLPDQPVPGHTIIVFPIGRLIRQWAYGCEDRVRDAA